MSALPTMLKGKARKKFFEELLAVFDEAECMCGGTYPPDEIEGAMATVRALRDRTFRILNGGRAPKILKGKQ